MNFGSLISPPLRLRRSLPAHQITCGSTASQQVLAVQTRLAAAAIWSHPAELRRRTLHLQGLATSSERVLPACQGRCCSGDATGEFVRSHGGEQRRVW